MSAPYDLIIIGAGAAGLMCAGAAGQRGKSVLVLDHADKAGEKIRISGGGRCNFTNLHCGPKNFISQNPHFCKSALSRYNPQDFIELIERHKIAWHEKRQTNMQLGQLFCDGSSQQIIDMLLSECAKGGVTLKLGQNVLSACKKDDGFHVTTGGTTARQSHIARNLVIACGGASIPKMGASKLGYELARQFGLGVVDIRPALVPLTLTDSEFEPLKALAGLATPANVTAQKTAFNEAVLITHRGLSGPAILQISSYLEPGQPIEIDLAPGVNINQAIDQARKERGALSPKSFIERLGIPARLAQHLARPISAARMADLSKAQIATLSAAIKTWRIKPAGTEGYRKAEVTLGGVDTADLSSKSLEAKSVKGLYFIGEVVDVTGHLGGHNFQWAWASGMACAAAID